MGAKNACFDQLKVVPFEDLQGFEHDGGARFSVDVAFELLPWVGGCAGGGAWVLLV
jgi:hypothetical protein